MAALALSLAAALLAPSATQPLVAVVGAGGNVGKLVALRLADSHCVRAVVRDASKVAQFLNRPNIEIVEAEVTGASAAPGGALERALRGAEKVVACTGTTAFPTKAWSTTGDTDVTAAFLSALLASKLDVRAALAQLDAQGLNTPRNVDDEGTSAILRAWGATTGGVRSRFVLMSSIGVTKRTGFPFSVLNACGVLDAKAAGESAVARDAKEGGYEYTIVRPGQLFGGPVREHARAPLLGAAPARHTARRHIQPPLALAVGRGPPARLSRTAHAPARAAARHSAPSAVRQQLLFGHALPARQGRGHAGRRARVGRLADGRHAALDAGRGDRALRRARHPQRAGLHRGQPQRDASLGGADRGALARDRVSCVLGSARLAFACCRLRRCICPDPSYPYG